MPNIASLLKTEIVRLARKEIRLELESLKKMSASQRSDIAALKKEVRTLRADLKRSSEARPQPTAASAEEGTTFRFRPASMKAHRLKLGLSAKDYGLLLEASALSVYKWEDGKVKPRDTALAKIAAVRGLQKREAKRRLEQLRQE